MSTKQFFAGAALVSLLACTAPAGAQVLGGSLGGTLNGGLSGGIGGLGGLGGPTSVATGTLRDANSIGRATTSHVHDTVDSATIATDRAAGRVDGQLAATRAAADATADSASSAGVSTAKAAPAKAEKAAEQRPVKPVKAEPVKAAPVQAEPTKREPLFAPNVDASASASTSMSSNASIER